MRKARNNPKQPGSLAAAFAADLLADWAEHGRDAIERARRWRPENYLHFVAATVPNMAGSEANELDGMTDEEIRARLATLLVQLADAGVDLYPAGARAFCSQVESPDGSQNAETNTRREPE